MAAKTDQPGVTREVKPELHDIEELRLMYRTPLAVCRGAMEQQGWRLGKHVSKAEYESATKRFLGNGKVGR